MWRELIAELIPTASLSEPAPAAALSDASDRLGHVLPGALASLMLESNGVMGDHGLGLVWDLDRIVADNLSFRQSMDFRDLYMPFDPLLFFGDAGNGDQFALLCPPVDRDDVFAWDHEDDSRTWVAPDLETYLRWWVSGRIQL
ncbi:MAG: SMI1/KNR4 family protein [Candidatus Nanopelagicales bacterium]